MLGLVRAAFLRTVIRRSLQFVKCALLSPAYTHVEAALPAASEYRHHEQVVVLAARHVSHPLLAR